MRAFASSVLFALGALLYLYWLYQLSIAVFGFRRRRPAPAAPASTRFLVLVPAHDEEAVIAPLLESLAAQTYPRERVAVYVSCDSCTDGTAAIAAARGAHVLERFETPPGKTANLRWALDRLPLADFDALVLFDADNLVSPDFLARTNDHLGAHPQSEAVQSYLETKNPDDSWVTRVYALTFWYTKVFWYRARANVGLSINLGGTGSVLRIPALKRWGWEWESLADDLELTCRIVLGGGKVDWCEEAIAFDEKPVTARASRSQRARWLQGHYFLAARFALPALGRFFRTGRRQYLDLFLFLVAPGRAAMSWATMFVGLALVWLWPPFAVFATIQLALVLVVAPSMRFGRLQLRYVPDVISYLVYGLRWLPSMFSAAVASRRGDAWVKTEHGRALTLDDVRRKE